MIGMISPLARTQRFSTEDARPKSNTVCTGIGREDWAAALLAMEELAAANPSSNWT
jgi:hypothetical protein